MDQCQCRGKLWKNFQDHWSIRIYPGKGMDQWLVHMNFPTDISMDQWRSKFSKSFSLDRHWSLECSSLWCSFPCFVYEKRQGKSPPQKRRTVMHWLVLVSFFLETTNTSVTVTVFLSVELLSGNLWLQCNTISWQDLISLFAVPLELLGLHLTILFFENNLV